MNKLRKIDQGTVIRTVLLLVALINQTLIMSGNPIIPIDEGQIISFIDAAYLLGSIGFSIVTIGAAWWKDNAITDKARKLRENALKAQGIIKK